MIVTRATSYGFVFVCIAGNTIGHSDFQMLLWHSITLKCKAQRTSSINTLFPVMHTFTERLYDLNTELFV